MGEVCLGGCSVWSVFVRYAWQIMACRDEIGGQADSNVWEVEK